MGWMLYVGSWIASASFIGDFIGRYIDITSRCVGVAIVLVALMVFCYKISGAGYVVKWINDLMTGIVVMPFIKNAG